MTTVKRCILLLLFAGIALPQFQGRSGDVEWIVARLGYPCDGEITLAAALCFEQPQGAFVHLRSTAIDFDGYRVMLFIRDKNGATREVVKYIDREKYDLTPTGGAWANILFDNIGRVKTRTLPGTEILWLQISKVRKTDVQPITVSLPQ